MSIHAQMAIQNVVLTTNTISALGIPTLSLSPLGWVAVPGGHVRSGGKTPNICPLSVAGAELYQFNTVFGLTLAHVRLFTASYVFLGGGGEGGLVGRPAVRPLIELELHRKITYYS